MFSFVVAFLIMVLNFILLVYTWGSGFYIFWDVPALLIVIVLPLLFQCVLCGKESLKAAFVSPLKKGGSQEMLRRADSFFKSLTKTIWLAAAIMFMTGGVIMCKNIEDLPSLGPNIAVMLIAPIYAALFTLIVIVPYRVIIERCVKE